MSPIFAKLRLPVPVDAFLWSHINSCLDNSAIIYSVPSSLRDPARDVVTAEVINCTRYKVSIWTALSWTEPIQYNDRLSAIQQELWLIVFSLRTVSMWYRWPVVAVRHRTRKLSDRGGNTWSRRHRQATVGDQVQAGVQQQQSRLDVL